MKRRIFKKEHDIFRKSFRSYLKDKIIPFYDEWEDAGVTPRGVWLEAGKNDFLCPTAAEKYGGAGADFLYSVIITEEMYYHGLSSLFWPLHNDIVFPYIELYAGETQKKKWIPGCISGETILAVAMTEPDAGSDLASLSTTAVRDGDHYIVNGSKIFISNGQLADLCVVAVRTDDAARPHAGVSLLVIESDRKGYRKGTNLKKIGMRAQDTSELFFDDCRVPVENLLGAEGEGFKYLMHNLQQERLVLAIGAYAAAEGALDITIDYVKGRKLFGKTLGKFQNTRFTLAEVATKVQLARSFLDDLIPRHMAGENVVREVSMAKYWLTELQFEAADKCLQMFGGYGYMREYLISRLFVDARVQRIYGGANEVLKEVIARHLKI
ncbi:MAG: acyl-CoA dehydrogenase [Desulfobacteraceae bacterium]|nr:acyl-CoA dehydrogenase family protein [Desulfobacteraceae bacterium]MBC2757527.1 acyl-CoA dehydrogenase [Desulfobacteraceae bacterium]